MVVIAADRLLIVLGCLRLHILLHGLLCPAGNDLLVLVRVTHNEQLKQAPPRLRVLFFLSALTQAGLLPVLALPLPGFLVRLLKNN